MALLDVKGLTKYFGGLRAVHDLSFQVHEGEILGLIGPQRRRQDHGLQPDCRIHPPDPIYSSYPCNTPAAIATGTETFYEQLNLLAGVQDLALLTPDPEDPTRFRGSATIAHQETELPGGMEIHDITVDWSLVRKP